MTDIELVIKMPEEIWERVKNGIPLGVSEYVKNGTPLPKGHGRLIDADKFINSLKGIERLHIDDELRSSILDVVNTNILVEADKAESEDKTE